MLFNQIDDAVAKITGHQCPDSHELQDRLDQYDLERLKSIYARVTGKNGDLLRRPHLCEEIKECYDEYIVSKQQRDPRHGGDIGSENRLVTLWNMRWRHSFVEVSFSPGQRLNLELFDCSDIDEWYGMAFEQLLFRSQHFSRIVTENPTLKQDQCYSELFDRYFDWAYHNYPVEAEDRDALRNWLLVLTVGLNLTKNQIVKLNVPYYFLYDTEGVHTQEEPSLAQLEDALVSLVPQGISLSELKFSVVFDIEQERLGYFHTTLPIFKQYGNDRGSPVKNQLLSRDGITDDLSVGNRYLEHDACNLKFSIEPQTPDSRYQILEEVFS